MIRYLELFGVALFVGLLAGTALDLFSYEDEESPLPTAFMPQSAPPACLGQGNRRVDGNCIPNLNFGDEFFPQAKGWDI